jgi:hypothetical protein
MTAASSSAIGVVLLLVHWFLEIPILSEQTALTSRLIVLGMETLLLLWDQRQWLFRSRKSDQSGD